MPTARDRPPEEAADHTTFARGLRLLLVIADRGEVRADELGVALEMPVSTVYRYLRTLGEFGFVDRRDGRYHVGPRLLIGSQANVSTEQLIRVADPVMQAITEASGETAVLTRRIGLSAVCLHQVESHRGLRVALEVGAALPLHAGAVARVLLADAPEEVLSALLEQGLEPVTAETPDAEALPALLEDTRRDGFAVSEGELVAGSVALAVPIRRPDGIVGAIGVLGPADRCDAAWRRRVLRHLRMAAGTVAERVLDPASFP
jgi:DNA-binding IclR family transcriptional regulator